MKLWTFQSLKSVNELKETGKLEVAWSRYSENDPFLLAYKWMVGRMENNGIDCGNFAPIWAWHSCGAYGAAPTLDTATNLLSLNEIEGGIVQISFECPNEIALLSNYQAWNDIIDHFIDYKEATKILPSLEKNLFLIQVEAIKDTDAIQACLPFLLEEWILDMESLYLPDSL